jgi:Kae1-associated kinase Bud32
MILKDDDKERVYFIDFGLSVSSLKVEDKAVDLHLLKQALESKHYKIWEECFKYVLEGYKSISEHYDAVIERLETVEKRGRYKRKKSKHKN